MSPPPPPSSDGWPSRKWHHGKATTLGAASGAVAGLVAITPAAGFVTPMGALIIGFVGGVLCYGGVLVKNVFKYDDALDVVGIHGLGGTWGALATGLFATASVGGVDGLFYGNPAQLWIQFVSVVATWAYCFVVSYILFKIVDALMGPAREPGRRDQGPGREPAQRGGLPALARIAPLAGRGVRVALVMARRHRLYTTKE